MVIIAIKIKVISWIKILNSIKCWKKLRKKIFWMYCLYYKTSFILYVKKIERVTWNCIAPSNGFRPSDKGGGGGVIHTRIEGGPGLKNAFSALRASVWSKNKRGGGGVIHTRIEGGPGLKNVFSALRASVWSKNKREAGPAGPSPGCATGPT